MQIIKKIAVAAVLAASFAGSASASVVQTATGRNFDYYAYQGAYDPLLGKITLADGTNEISALTTSMNIVDQGGGGQDPTNGVYIGLYQGSTRLWMHWVAGASHSWTTQSFNIANDPTSLAALNAALVDINWSLGQPVTMNLMANAWGYPAWALHVNNETFSVTSEKVPEPASVALLGLGLAGIAAARRKSKKA